MKKDKEKAMKLIKQARELERNPALALDYDIPGMINEASNLCPHDRYERRKGLDTEGIRVWRCLDCGNDNYKRRDQ